MSARLFTIASRIGLCAAVLALPLAARAADPIYLNQGPAWTPDTRAAFYSQDQGSRIMPLSWLAALKQPNGQPFLSDSLGRYGYLPNPANTNSLPVGFTSSGPTGSQIVGMTCSACHTRQITVDGKDYRIDGGPAIVDFQAFLADLDAAVGQVLKDDASFQSLAKAVLGPNPLPADVALLRSDLTLWYLRYHTLMMGALPTPGWGPGRLDAVGMIFNRLTGLDLGPPPTFLIAENIKKADAPVRYPFLWNAARQDLTQWPGFADNGSDILGLARNVGEVYGVFAVYQPKKEWWHLLGVNYLNNNSANFNGLNRLEDLIKQIGPSKWPWSIDLPLAAQGQAIYKRSEAEGGCGGCHDIKPGKIRFPFVQTWATPLIDVGTDTREYDVLAWTALTGELQGAEIPFIAGPLQQTEPAVKILAVSVVGSIVQTYVPLAAPLDEVERKLQLKSLSLPPALRDLIGAFHLPGSITPPSGNLAAAQPKDVYEARVLEGVWAAAPYLHNGSVATLADLLKPAAERTVSFKIGPAYDTENVGIAAAQTKFDSVLTTTDCSARNSGNSRCGHEYGTKLSPAEKKALIEYLKTL
jgi:mono/diheme cytochrome c family protein